MTKIENIRKWIKNKAGVSPIIAIILMVAITVVLAATIYVWVSGFGGGGSKAISMSITQLDSATDHNATFRVDSVSQGAKWDDLEIRINNTADSVDTSNSSVTNFPIEGVINAGTTFYVNSTGLTPGATITIIDKTSNSVVLTKSVW